MKVQVIAKKGFGVTKKGGRVWLPKDQAAALVKMGIAELAPVEVVKAAPVASKGTYARRDMVAESRKVETPKSGPVPGVTMGTITTPTSRYSFSKDDGKA